MNKVPNIALLAFLTMPALLQAQTTGAQATPQTQQSAPAAIRGGNNKGRPGTVARPAGSNTEITPAPTGGRRAAAPRRRSSPARPAEDSSILVIGANDSSGQPGSIGLIHNGGELPGVTIRHNALGIPIGAPITVHLQQTITSAQAKNGDTIQAVLAQPVGNLPSGAPVELTVVAAAKAGVVGSGGVLSIQITHIDGQPVLSEVVTAQGKEGRMLLPNDAPGIGYEAEFTQDTPVTLPAA